MSSSFLKKDTQSQCITINIEGTVFKTYKRTCEAVPGSLLESLNETSEYYDDSTGMYHFDRDSRLFTHILAAHRERELHVPRDVCPFRFRKEIEFWRIPHKLLSECCWKYYYDCDDDITTLNDVIESLPRTTTLSSIGMVKDTASPDHTNGNVVIDGKCKIDERVSMDTLKHRIWLFLDEPQTSTAAKVWCFSYMFIVLISVILNIIWLDMNVRVEPYLHHYIDQFTDLELFEMLATNDTSVNLKIQTLLLTDPHKALFVIDCFCTVFFVMETVVHFSVCPRKTRYLFSPYNVLKVLLSICMIVGVVYEVRKDWLTSENIGIMWFILKSMNTLRVVLIVRLHKLYTDLHLIYLSIRHSLKEMLLLVILLLFTVLIYGGLIFSMEIGSEMFSDTRKAMWWALITMTTIGYGDFYPTETLGYLIGLMCAINGLLVIALPIAAISSNFARIYSRNSDLQKHVDAVRRDDNRSATNS